MKRLAVLPVVFGLILALVGCGATTGAPATQAPRPIAQSEPIPASSDSGVHSGRNSEKEAALDALVDGPDMQGWAKL